MKNMLQQEIITDQGRCLEFNDHDKLPIYTNMTGYDITFYNAYLFSSYYSNRTQRIISLFIAWRVNNVH